MTKRVDPHSADDCPVTLKVRRGDLTRIDQFAAEQFDGNRSMAIRVLLRIGMNHVGVGEGTWLNAIPTGSPVRN